MKTMAGCALYSNNGNDLTDVCASSHPFEKEKMNTRSHQDKWPPKITRRQKLALILYLTPLWTTTIISRPLGMIVGFLLASATIFLSPLPQENTVTFPEKRTTKERVAVALTSWLERIYMISSTDDGQIYLHERPIRKPFIIS